MRRINLVPFEEFKVTEDTQLSISLLINRAKNFGWKIGLIDPFIKTDLFKYGREVCFHIEPSGDFDTDMQNKINALWGLAVPLGFTPYNRYPLNDDLSFIFHYFGEWKYLMDRLLAEGRGHLMWDSLICACACDIGEWGGDNTLVRMIQAQLHRTGFNCGVIDGILGSRTLNCLQKNGLVGVELKDALEFLLNIDPKKEKREVSTKGFISIPNRDLQVSCYGNIQAVESANGISIESNGYGRLIIDIGEINEQ